MSNWLEKIKDVWPWSSERQGAELSVETDSVGPERLEDRPLATPLVDIFESDRELLLVADVPGAQADNSKIYWDAQRGLQLYVQRMTARSTGDGTAKPDWYRAFRLPDYVDPHEARSSVRNGVLRISIPRRPDAKPVAIPVRAAK